MNTRSLLAKLGPFLGLLLVIGLFSLPTEVRGYFLTYANFKIILTQTVIVAIGALGMTLIIVSGGIDHRELGNFTPFFEVLETKVHIESSKNAKDAPLSCRSDQLSAAARGLPLLK